MIFNHRYQSIRRTINQPRPEQETSAESTSSGKWRSVSSGVWKCLPDFHMRNYKILRFFVRTSHKNFVPEIICAFQKYIHNMFNLKILLTRKIFYANSFKWPYFPLKSFSQLKCMLQIISKVKLMWCNRVRN